MVATAIELPAETGRGLGELVAASIEGQRAASEYLAGLRVCGGGDELQGAILAVLGAPLDAVASARLRGFCRGLQKALERTANRADAL